MSSAFTLKVDPNGIGSLIFDLPNEKVNKLSTSVLAELEEMVDELYSHNDIRLLVISSAKKDVFIAGADVREIQTLNAESAIDLIKGGHRVFNKLQHLPFPTVALINGVCLGGGTEFALSCTYRIVTDNPKTIIGLPEVNLGIMPGWGGTQRLPRLIGLQEGLQMILTGKPVNALKAYKLKLADAIVPAEFAEAKASEFVSLALSPNGQENILKRRGQRGLSTLLLEKNPLGRSLLFYQAKKALLEKTKGHYPAPLLALEVIKETSGLPLEDGLKKEVEMFLGSRTTDFRNSKNLTTIFFTSESLKKDAGVPLTAPPKAVKSAGVLGLGTMGAGISWLLSNQNIPVRMKDINWEAVAKGYAGVYDIYKQLVKIRKLKPNEANLKFHRVSGTTDYSGFENLDLIVEAATENLGLKIKIFSELENVAKADAIIATNTSSLRVDTMAAGMKHPERFVGMHFFNPVNRMPLVEVVPGEKTSPEALATAVELCRKLGKTPIVVGDCAGFLVNRVFVAGANEILFLFQEGVEMSRLSRLMLDFGMPMDPFELSDEVGNDVGYHVAKTFEEAYGPRFAAPKILTPLYDNKLYGKKTGKGFYVYSGKSKKVNSAIFKYVESQASKGLPDQDIIDRVIFAMCNEAARCLEEKIILRADYLDMAMILGTGFPPFRGGVLRYADSRGIDAVVDRLKAFEQLHGLRFKPAERLLEMQKSSQSFYVL